MQIIRFALTLLPSGKVLAAGDTTRSSNTFIPYAEIYDPLTRSWSDTRMLNVARANHQSIYSGGRATFNDGLTSCERYYL